MRSLSQPNAAFLGDVGDPEPSVRSALHRAQGSDRAAYLDAVVALGGARLLMPIVASGDDDMDGPDPDRHAEMAAVSIQAPDGRRGLVAFTGLDALQAWDARARPVPCTLDDLAATVAEAGASALILDVAGPWPLVLEDDLLTELAAGRRLVHADLGYAWAYLADADVAGNNSDNPA